MSNGIRSLLIGAVVALIIGGGIGYVIGSSQGQTAGYAAAQADLQKVQDEAGKKAVSEASKAANPFQLVNPLENVETNPFQKTKQVLNPFE
jgi:flagellar basal body-associated protein FliL